MFEDVAERLQDLKLDDALNRRYSMATMELDRLIEDKQRQPVTYDPAYTTTVQESRSRKTTAKIRSLMEQARVDVRSGFDDEPQAYVNPEVLQNSLKELVDPDMDKTSAEDALDSELAYYKVIQCRVPIRNDH